MCNCDARSLLICKCSARAKLVQLRRVLITHWVEIRFEEWSAVVATLVKARDDELESDDRSASSLASSNPGGAAFANCILGVALANLRKRYFHQLHPRVG